MTAQEAIEQLSELGTWFKPESMVSLACQMGSEALAASIPHVLTLDEARALELHTAVWLEYRVNSIKTAAGWRSLCWLRYAEAAVKRCAMRNRVSDYKPAARIWIGAWPSEELRTATPWEG